MVHGGYLGYLLMLRPDPTSRNHGFHENGSIAAVAPGRPGELHSRYITGGPLPLPLLSRLELSRGQEIIRLLGRQYNRASRVRFCLVSLISRPITSHALSAYHQATRSLLFPPPPHLCFEHPGHILTSGLISLNPTSSHSPAYRESSGAIATRPYSASSATQDIISYSVSLL